MEDWGFEMLADKLYFPIFSISQKFLDISLDSTLQKMN